MVIGSLDKPFGSGLKIVAKELEIPASYIGVGLKYKIDGIDNIVAAIPIIENNPGDKLITWEIYPGGWLKIHINTIKASTDDGSISATEDAPGTDESGLKVKVVVIGY